MDVIIIFNGLGNQMSQYAFYLQKKQINPSTYAITFCRDHNGFELDSVFNINFNKSIRQRTLYLIFRLLLTEKLGLFGLSIKNLFNSFNVKIQRENFDFSFKPQYLVPAKGITFYYGGWHTPSYFKSVNESVLGVYNFNNPSDIENINIINKIISFNSVSLHVRRGDYINSSNIDLFGGVCTIDYYKNAINLILEKVDDCHFFVFSNDMKWVQENLHLENFTYVDNNNGLNSWLDMYLMSLCNHNIIANSTFSWWGAWLNKHLNKIVISPNKFLNKDLYTEVYPENWLKIGV